MKYQQHEKGHNKKMISFDKGTTLRGPEKEEDHHEIPTTEGLEEEKEDQS